MKLKRKITLLLLLVITPLGFLSKLYNGTYANWLNNSFGGILYEIFWCLVIFFFLYNSKILKIVFGVFLITSSLEFLQLWHPPFLQLIRSNFIGRTIIGTSFVPSDFVYYLIGSCLGWFILTWISNLQVSN